jgi:hypothetical protein
MPEHLILALRRLASDLRDFKSTLHRIYRRPAQQVTSVELIQKAAAFAEMWLADLSQRHEMNRVSPEALGDLNVLFQRLLVCTDRKAVRRTYDRTISLILRNYTAEVVVRIMQGGNRPESPIGSDQQQDVRETLTGEPEEEEQESFKATAFVGHSFAPEDTPIVAAFIGILEALGIKVVTGTKPRRIGYQTRLSD